ncbi:MAG: hypothetical protein KKE17_05090 [Proteobacteria bacterium]|nr:hypothetical protein [Pseudomonadota bacterium]MBU1709364.1 hypothetical protein [Pseudomonadota bacterium]
MKKIILILSLVFPVLPGLLHAADTLYVQSVSAKLMDAPKFNAKVVARFEQGQELSVKEQKGSWYMVEADKQQGWISRLLVSLAPPMEKISLITTSDTDVSKNARRRASTVATAGAARGLAADDRRRANQALQSNFASLAFVEGITVSPQELNEFIQNGVGE